MADWSRLPEEILVLISKRMQTGSDVRHFRSVCTSWRSSVPPPKPPRSLKIPTYDRHVANHFYLVERTIYYVESPKTHKFCFVKVEEDEHGKMSMLHPLTNSKIKSSGSQNVLDSLNLHVFESNKEYVLQYEPKNHAAWEFLEYDDESKLAFKRVAFRRLSQDNEDFELLLEHCGGGLVLFESADMQWTRLLYYPLYWDYYVISINQSFHIFHERRSELGTLFSNSYRPKIFLIQSPNGKLVKVEICPSREHHTRSVGQLDCFNSNGKLVSFRISLFHDDQEKWEIVEGLGDSVIFLGTKGS